MNIEAKCKNCRFCKEWYLDYCTLLHKSQRDDYGLIRNTLDSIFDLYGQTKRLIVIESQKKL